MRNTLLSVSLLLFIFSLPSYSKPNITDASYAFGYAMAEQYLTRDGQGISVKDFIQGMQDYVNKKPSRIPMGQRPILVRYYDGTIREVKANQLQEENSVMLASSKKFLKENATKEGVKTNKEGIQYRIIQKGKGTPATDNDIIQFKYSTSTLSKQEQKPEQTMSVKGGAMKKGWLSALNGVREGEELEIFVPPNPRYFQRGVAAITLAADVSIYKVKVTKIMPYEHSDE